MTTRWWAALRVAFVVAVLSAAWWSWRWSGDEVRAAFACVDPWRAIVSFSLVACGVALTGLVWRSSLEAFVAREPLRTAVPPFFVAQLGKYIPGGVWSFVAQGALGARQDRSPRLPVAAALLFLGVHVASGLVLTGLVGWWSDIPRWVVIAALPVGLLGLAPVVHRRLGRRLSGAECDWRWSRSLHGSLVMTVVWCCYTSALVVLTSEPTVSDALTLGVAFAVAFAVGAAVPVAPAGIGAREGVLLLLVVPVLGAGPAGVVTVLARLAHTVADFALAGVSWLVMRNVRR